LGTFSIFQKNIGATDELEPYLNHFATYTSHADLIDVLRLSESRLTTNGCVGCDFCNYRYDLNSSIVGRD